MDSIHMNASSNAEQELMRQEIFRIGAKMDALPQIYITRNEHDPWRNSVEKRFDEYDKKFDEIEKLKTEGARWTLEERERIHKQIRETEQHLQEKQEKISHQVTDVYDKLSEKIDANAVQQATDQKSAAKDSRSWRQTLYVTGFMALITLLGYVINYLTTHPLPH